MCVLPVLIWVVHIILLGIKLLGCQMWEHMVKAALALQEPPACRRSTLGGLELQDETSISLADWQQPGGKLREVGASSGAPGICTMPPLAFCSCFDDTDGDFPHDPLTSSRWRCIRAQSLF